MHFSILDLTIPRLEDRVNCSLVKEEMGRIITGNGSRGILMKSAPCSIATLFLDTVVGWNLRLYIVLISTTIRTCLLVQIGV